MLVENQSNSNEKQKVSPIQPIFGGDFIGDNDLRTIYSLAPL